MPEMLLPLLFRGGSFLEMASIGFVEFLATFHRSHPCPSAIKTLPCKLNTVFVIFSTLLIKNTIPVLQVTLNSYMTYISLEMQLFIFIFQS